MKQYKVTRYYTAWESTIIEAETEDDAYDIALEDDWLDWKVAEGEQEVTIHSIRVVTNPEHTVEA